MGITRIIIFAVLALPALAHATGINIPHGASMSLGNGNFNLGCNDVTIAGSFDVGSGRVLNARHLNIAGGSVNAGSGQVQLAGDWNNNGIFIPGSSVVAIQDGCATTRSALNGDTSFHTFTATTTSGKTLQAAAGSTQVFNNSLTLKGMAGKPLLVRSSQVGNQAFFTLAPDGTQNINAVDVMDNNAQGGQRLALNLPAQLDSVDSGNNLNWFLGVLVPIPTLPWPALIFLALVLMATAFRRRLREKSVLIQA